MDTPSAHIITPDTTICAGQSFQIRVYGTSGLSYSWTPATGLSSPTVMEPIASPVITTTYSMTATLPGSGCPPILSDVTVTIHDLNVSLLTPNDTICIGSSVNLRVAGSPAYNYSWSPATGLSNPYSQDPVATPTVTTTYHVSVSDSGCSGSSSLTITVLNPDPAILTQDTAICDGVSFTLQVLSNPGITYLWTPSSGLSNPNIPDPVASPTVSVTYTLTATTATSSGIPCSANNEIIVTVLPPLLVNAGPDQSICLNSAIKLSATPEGNQYSYTWSGPDGFNSNLENPSIFKAQPAYQGIYSVTVTNTSTGCSGQDTTFVTVYMGSFNLTNVTPSQTISYGSSIQLNADNGLYYMWTPDNGTLSNPNINNPVATPLIPTTYTVYAMDIHGCNDSASVTIDLTYSDIFIPSAFTPNGDGLNDVFAVGHLGLNKLVEMSVFNRWGQLVYHAEGSESKGWDGTFNGVLQDMGVFNYLIIVNKPNTGDQVYKGNVTLIK
jgi:gliding motility-associated-like protein